MTRPLNSAGSTPPEPAAFSSGEAVLAAAWERRWWQPGPLCDSSGRSFELVFPGRRWGGPGPDFRGAILALPDGTLVRGDIEVHLRAADWRAHGHHRDPGYNATVLQVVLHPDAGPAFRENGTELPTLALAPRLVEPLSRLALWLRDGVGLEAAVCLESPEAMIQLLDRAALARFFEKAGRFEADLSVLEPAEVVYRAFLVTLGYSANVAPFGRLSELLPWDLVRRVGRTPTGLRDLSALLLGAAGLLRAAMAPPFAAAEPAGLQASWLALRPELALQPLERDDWQLGAHRPANDPVRRLFGAAWLLSRWAWADSPQQLLAALLARQRAPAALVELFVAPTPRLPPDAPALIGRQRAGEILVNVLLPFAYAVGQQRDRADLSAAALLAYHRLPGGGWNRLSRAMAAQLFGSDGARYCRGAARKQGLLHLYRRWCWQRDCGRCLAGPGPATSGSKPAQVFPGSTARPISLSTRPRS